MARAPARVTLPPALSRWLGLLLAGVVGVLAGCASAAVVPGQWNGDWEVVQVAVDHRDQPHWAWFPDDPRLLGRQLHIAAADIRLDDDSRPCTQPVFQPLDGVGLQEFIGTRFARPEHFGTPAAPTLQDFALDLSDTAVMPVTVACGEDTSPWQGAWLLSPAPGTLLTNFDNGGYVLVLRRRAADEPVRASFDCAGARSASEQAICRSPALAAWDSSVAAAYRRARTTSADVTALKREQTTWLAARNACAGDAACLAGQMRDRVEQLMQQ